MEGTSTETCMGMITPLRRDEEENGKIEESFSYFCVTFNSQKSFLVYDI